MMDVRAIANIVLDHAETRSIDVSNMALNKIVYFVHSDFLIEVGKPLVSARIAAWQHGPVFRELYHQFKNWGDKPIKARASKVDANTGEVVTAFDDLAESLAEHIKTLTDRYLGFSAAQLRAMSHRQDGPWHRVWGHDKHSNPGMRITDELILSCHLTGARQ